MDDNNHDNKGDDNNLSTISVDEKVAIESQIMTHVAVDRMAKQIASDLQETTAGHRVAVLYGPDAGGLLSAFRAFQTEAEALWEMFEHIAPDTGGVVPRMDPGSIGAAITAASAGVELLSLLLRTDTSYSGRVVEVAESVLAAGVASCLGNVNQAKEVHVPQLFTAPAPTSNPVIKALTAIRAARQNAAARVEALSDDDPEKKVAEARLAQAEQTYTAFEARLVAGDKGATPLIQSLYQGSVIAETLDSGGRVVFVSIEKTGGTIRTRRWAFLSTLDHSGGAVASYSVFDAGGRLLTAATRAEYAGPRRFKPSKTSVDPLLELRSAGVPMPPPSIWHSLLCWRPAPLPGGTPPSGLWATILHWWRGSGSDPSTPS